MSVHTGPAEDPGPVPTLFKGMAERAPGARQAKCHTEHDQHGARRPAPGTELRLPHRRSRV